MDAELKSKWIAALRGGGYKQAQFKLRNNHGAYCCLGVLCVVAGLPISNDGGGVDPDNDYIPIETIISTERKAELAHMNDSGKSFLEIADYIEANL